MNLDPRLTVRTFDIIGHRGSKGHAPENTLAAFEMAVEMGVSMLELDVHLSDDQQLIVIHDSMVDRTTDGTGFVHEMTFDQLKTLDAGAWYAPEYAGQRVPTLPEVLDLVGGRVPVNIEMKQGGLGAGSYVYEQMPQVLADCLTKHGAVSDVVISAFHEPYLAAVKALLPDARLALLHERPVSDLFQQAVAKGWEAVHTYFAFVAREFVEAAHSAGIQVRAWTVNDPRVMRQLINAGVDGVITDTPDVLRRVAAEAGLPGTPRRPK